LTSVGVTLEARPPDRLRFRAPEGVMTPERLALLREHKPALIALIERQCNLDGALALALRRNAELAALNPALAGSVEQTARERRAAGDLRDLLDLPKTIARSAENSRRRR
jgi:hypothetical protein